MLVFEKLTNLPINKLEEFDEHYSFLIEYNSKPLGVYKIIDSEQYIELFLYLKEHYSDRIKFPLDSVYVTLFEIED